jgi:RND family efflux transporter MFP subunit
MYRLKRFSLICLLFSVGLFFASCGGRGETEIQPRPVRFQQVFSSGAARERTFSGVSRAGVESRLSFKVAGTVIERPMMVGDRVRKGQILARLDDRDYRLEVQQVDAALVQAKADARNANAVYERVRALYENNNASRNDLDQARAGAEIADAAVQTAEKRLELARLQVSYTRLTAPLNGAIASVDVQINENVTQGQVVAMLTAGDRPEVEVAMPGALIALINRGDPVTLTFEAVPGRTMAGEVYEVGVAATGVATTFPVTVRLAEAYPEVRPGMAARVTFELGAAGGAEQIVLPPYAVGEDHHGRFAYVVEPAAEAGLGVARRRAVTVGEITGSGLQILDGIEDGDLVVTAGISRLQDGQLVRLPGEEGDNR